MVDEHITAVALGPTCSLINFYPRVRHNRIGLIGAANLRTTNGNVGITGMLGSLKVSIAINNFLNGSGRSNFRRLFDRLNVTGHFRIMRKHAQVGIGLARGSNRIASFGFSNFRIAPTS